MKYKLEIQSDSLNISTDEILERVKESLKHKKCLLTKVKNLHIYYVPLTKVVYYAGIYDGKEVKSSIYL